jgi:nitrogen fixation-related uncharacterized protein|tara:strand:+ start:164 stop:268 length:105 start_codon:yes stop_codon:yes gene_type:complete
MDIKHKEAKKPYLYFLIGLAVMAVNLVLISFIAS